MLYLYDVFIYVLYYVKGEMDANAHEKQPHTNKAKQNKPMIHIGFAVKSSIRDTLTAQQIPNGPRPVRR